MRNLAILGSTGSIGSSTLDVVKSNPGMFDIQLLAAKNNHPLLQIIEEISAGILSPVRKFMPPMGGLDFTPIIGLLVLNLINTSLVKIISSLV